jgi:hypothetical protein
MIFSILRLLVQGSFFFRAMLRVKGLQSNLDKKKVLAAYLGGPS